MKQPLRFLFLEPFYGGSHRDIADGLTAHSRHEIELVTLPDRFWKWRMRGAAIYWSRRIEHPEQYDGLIASSLLNLADLKALWGVKCPPPLVYFHENQLTYPSAPDNRHDHQPGFTNIITALTARRMLFNSRTHLSAFLSALPQFIRIMPDFRPKWVTKVIEAKSAVAHPGCHFSATPCLRPGNAGRVPLIIWNHRWEHDKNPEAFFKALENMIQRGIDFQVALLGEEYAQMPAVFKQAPQILEKRLVQYGRVPSRQEYYQWLDRGDIVISTAFQENFGISVVEAVWHGCLPLLPHRLSYPEILPDGFHHDCLYSDQDDLENKLAALLTHLDQHEERRRDLAMAMSMFAWEKRIGQFDEELAQLVISAAAPKDGCSYNPEKEYSI
jgi:glycosyltransferase involved in cell wall biosynthesis